MCLNYSQIKFLKKLCSAGKKEAIIKCHMTCHMVQRETVQSKQQKYVQKCGSRTKLQQ